MNRINELQKYFRADDQKDFDKRLLSIVPHLHPYVKHRLYIAESTGILPRNMYCSNGIIDDAIVSLYNDRYELDVNTLSLELKLFKIADELIDELYIREGWHQKNISTSYILKEELSKLEEVYTVEADNELIMNEELSDICYYQHVEKKQAFIYDDTDSDILKIIDSEHSTENKKQKLLGKFYSWLPMETSKIIDLFVFGKLNFEEIATIREITAQEVKEIIIDVRKSFRKNLI
ncbi:hypothetical protein [Aquimarina sp. 2201CG5-10]|uniref:hypothetical protein n=1 Tax=Aquimarina callyspongiae TaxID=3098150 RepID=UPI002AB54774|nr:hypothetical protein [Aquimarina sp. 2201CG5-10]MDY8138202.1 hypothetical protein [Aquimarina sp. 2201CG5-10]